MSSGLPRATIGRPVHVPEGALILSGVLGMFWALVPDFSTNRPLADGGASDETLRDAVNGQSRKSSVPGRIPLLAGARDGTIRAIGPGACGAAVVDRAFWEPTHGDCYRLFEAGRPKWKFR
jgi:hypothetical protein